jgi:hypothetical protein
MTMSRKLTTLMVLLLSLTILSACSFPGSGADKKDPETVYTEAAATVAAQLTAMGPRGTQRATTAPDTGVQTPVPSNTPSSAQNQPTQPPAAQIPSPTTNAAIADKAQYISNDPPDGSSVVINTPFTVTWVVKNVGQTTWTTSYQMRYFAGEKFGSPASVNLPQQVEPNQQVNITVNLTAPSNPGDYSGIWVLTNADGANYQALDISLKIVNQPTATVTPTVTLTPTVTSTPEE